MLSGRQLDAQFAEGFLASAQGGRAEGHASQHWRPVADLGPLLGKTEGDAALFVDDDSARNTLVVVEREGSAPGNERNALKWYQAVLGGHEIRLRSRGKETGRPYDRVIVWMAFGRSSKWPENDFSKTVEFCRLQAPVLNNGGERLAPSFKVVVRALSMDPVVDWRECGRAHGAALMDGRSER